MSAPAIWRTLPWLTGYEVSDAGELRRTANKSRKCRAGGTLRGTITTLGYLKYQVRIDGRPQNLHASRLVCEAWHGPCPPDKPMCAHWDGNKLNNHFSNLRWATPAENGADSTRLGTCGGANHSQATLTWQQIDEIRHLRNDCGMSLKEVAERFGIDFRHVSAIATGRIYSGVRGE